MTITPDAGTGSVLLDIERAGLTVYRVLRTDANGSAEVRGMEGQFPALPGEGSAARVILTDYEAAAGDLLYSVETSAGTVNGSTVLELSSPWLTVPLMPNLSEPVPAVMDYSAARPALGRVHEVLYRADPLPVLRALGFRAGSLVIEAGDLADALRIERVFTRRQVVMFRGLVPGMDMYLVPESVSHSPVQSQDGNGYTYEVTVSYRQVARPAGAQSGALGWTYNALLESYGTYAALAAAFDSYDDLTINRPRGAA